MFELLKNSFRAAKEALEFRLAYERQEGDLLGESSSPPELRGMFFQAKMLIVADTLCPPHLKQWVKIASSVKFGRYLLQQTFPRDLNPNDYHSTQFEVDLTEHPVQELSWDDINSRKAIGRSQGLDPDWIDYGFEDQAETRGIDPEFHLFQNPPTKKLPSNTSSLVVKR